MPDFTIVLAHRGNLLGLWATILSCEEELRYSNFDYNYVIVANGEVLDHDAQNCLAQIEQCSKVKLIKHPETLSPPAARQMGADASEGKYIFFLDNHCLVARDYFRRAMANFDHFGMDVLHSATKFWAGQETAFHYRLKLDHNFWADAALLVPVEERPYKCAAGGHGGFAVNRSSWNEIGGYGPQGFFVGYGGEELYFDLKAWLLGKTVWMEPKMLHYHYAGARGYARSHTNEFYVNMMACANVIGGEKWMTKVYESFSTPEKFMRQGYPQTKTWFDLLTEASDRSAQHRKELEAIRSMSLDDLLVWFRENNIAR